MEGESQRNEGTSICRGAAEEVKEPPAEVKVLETPRSTRGRSKSKNKYASMSVNTLLEHVYEQRPGRTNKFNVSKIMMDP